MIEEEKTIIQDPNPGQTFLNEDFDHSDLKREDVQLAMDFFEDYADDGMKKEMNANQGDGMQLGNSATLIKHVAVAAKRQVSALEEVANSPGNKFYGYPAKTPEQERQIAKDGRALLNEALEKARNEFIQKSRRPLPGRLTKPGRD